uniref:Uncharacterized protein n=1 Tax=Eutreptiella gymnastica TaxID=73025 RepID=A0A7S1IAN9_9EUGL
MRSGSNVSTSSSFIGCGLTAFSVVTTAMAMLELGRQPIGNTSTQCTRPSTCDPPWTMVFPLSRDAAMHFTRLHVERGRLCSQMDFGGRLLPSWDGDLVLLPILHFVVMHFMGVSHEHQ